MSIAKLLRETFSQHFPTWEGERDLMVERLVMHCIRSRQQLHQEIHVTGVRDEVWRVAITLASATPIPPPVPFTLCKKELKA